MSTRVDYEPELFHVERLVAASAAAGEFILGQSLLGHVGETTWTAVPSATFTYSEDYQPNDAGVLIYGSQQASVSLSYWGNPPSAPLYSGDHVRVRYDNKVLFRGTVDSARFTYSVEPEAADYGRTHRTDFTATLVGTYATALSKRVCWTTLPPGELAITRIRRYVTVDNWEG